ncbi:segregation and condensation protein A [Thalassomonas sp. M1454]|uniref:segregation and condensation protein A n=1 Tax=Thalassomonas sp. M1454 TaxID=2594477 RepID=UPI00117CADD4|nr:ScpA family protein [Thalassomonas sp. M1454]TRX55910.1 segregation/condensation protein A [Thalassomonas sp. M1454]
MQDMVQQVLPLAMVRGEALVKQPLDLFIPPDALEIILDSFEGPLDLLLYLIRKQKFDIVDLPIAEITHQYMEYVELMKDVKIELAAEYLVMAAILAEIKSRLLLPKTDVVDDEEDPRAELVRRLQEYEVIKDAANKLDTIPRLERDNFEGRASLPENYKPRFVEADVSLDDLVQALQGVIKRVEAFEHHHIKRENLSTRERMSQILATLEHDSYKEFSTLFVLEEGRGGVVVTFLAILELLKENLIEFVQAQVFGQIQVKLATIQ